MKTLKEDSQCSPLAPHEHAYRHAHACTHHISIHISVHIKEIHTFNRGYFISPTFPSEARGKQMNIFIRPSRLRVAIFYVINTDSQDLSTE